MGPIAKGNITTKYDIRTLEQEVAPPKIDMNIKNSGSMTNIELKN